MFRIYENPVNAETFLKLTFKNIELSLFKKLLIEIVLLTID